MEDIGEIYKYYVNKLEYEGLYPITFKDFINAIETNKTLEELKSVHGGIPKYYHKIGYYNKQN